MGKQATEILKGVLEGIVLAILSDRPAYGYETVSYTHLDVYKRQGR